jgi:predicted phosphodiesterase
MPLGSVWLCGDVHGDLRTLERALKQASAPPCTLIFLGDLDPPKPVGGWLSAVTGSEIDSWFIHGNHETDSDAAFLNTFHVPDAERNIDGRVVEIAGLRVAGLGGVFREEVWYPPAAPHVANYDALYDHWLVRTPMHQRHALPALSSVDERPIFSPRLRKHRSSIFPDAYHRLADQEADVLIVHEAPSCHPHGFAAIDLLAQAMGVHHVVHGHHHDALDYRADSVRLGFRTLGVGLRGITTLAGDVIVAGELDSVRTRDRQRIDE